MLSSVYSAVKRGEHMQIQSLLALNFLLIMGVAPAKIIFMVILSSEVAFVSSPNITKKGKQTNVRIHRD